MPPTDDDISSLLEQVSDDDLRQYLRAREIPLPPDTSDKKTLIKTVLAYANGRAVARAALWIELRAGRDELKELQKKAADEMAGFQKTQNESLHELRREVAAVRSLKTMIEFGFGIVGVLVVIGSFVGFKKLSELEMNASDAQTQAETAAAKLATVNAVLEAYQTHLTGMIEDDLALVMDCASTRWFVDSEKPVAEVIRKGQSVIASLARLPEGSTSRDLTVVMDDVYRALKSTGSIRSAPSVEEALADLRAIENEWGRIESSLAQNTTLEAQKRDRLKAYVHNMMGLVCYRRARLTETAGDLNQAEMRFRRAMESDPRFSAARSNLAVLLLDRIESSTTSGANTPAELLAKIPLSEELLSQARRDAVTPAVASRICNNLAYSQLQRAHLHARQRDFLQAREALKEARVSCDEGLSMLRAVSILWSTRAEIVAFQAVLMKQEQGGVSEEQLEGVVAELRKAVTRDKAFHVTTREKLIADSPSLGAFIEAFHQKERDILDAVGLADGTPGTPLSSL